MRERSSGWGSVNSEYDLLEAWVEWPLASKSREALLPKDDRGPEGRPNDLCIAGTPALLRSREEHVPSSSASRWRENLLRQFVTQETTSQNFALGARFFAGRGRRGGTAPTYRQALYFTHSFYLVPLDSPRGRLRRFTLDVKGCDSWRLLQGIAVLPARDAHHHLACVPRPR